LPFFFTDQIKKSNIFDRKASMQILKINNRFFEELFLERFDLPKTAFVNASRNEIDQNDNIIEEFYTAYCGNDNM